ncbi:MAG: hypothetical protein IID33_14400 [Planctomycetes bacterium]|nr:hypothetical protein [Planctomycetota bacterium]
MITPMCRVEIVCLNPIRDAVIRSLHAQGLLHIDNAEIAPETGAEAEIEGDEIPVPFFSPVNLEGDSQRDLVSIEELERSLNEVLPLLSAQPSEEDLSAAVARVVAASEEEWTKSLREKATALREMTRERVALVDNIDVLGNYRLILKQVLPALGGPDTVLGKGTRAIVLSGDVDRAVTQLQEDFDAELGAACKFLYNKTGENNLVGLISFPEAKGDVVSGILSSHGINPVDLSDDQYRDASISEVISRIEAAMEAQRVEVADLRSQIEAASKESGPELVAMKSIVSDKLSQLRVKTQFAESQMVTVMQGWTPRDRFPALEKTVEDEFPGQVDVNRIDHEGAGDKAIPTLLSNPALFQPFEVVLKLFKPPTYGTIDPTIMVAISFVVFYGFIVGDVVYGIVIWLTAHALGKKWQHIPAVVDVGKIGKYMGLSTMVFGVLFGEYAGEIFGISPLWFHRGHDTNKLLIYALYMGIFHIITALCLGIYENYKHGHMDHAAGIAYYLSQRNFVDICPGRVIVHRGLAGPIQQLMATWGDIEGHHTPGQIYGVESLEDVPIRRDLLVRAFAVNHAAYALGFALIEIRHKLKPEYHGKSGPQLVALKRTGVEIEARTEVPLLVYTGDTAVGPFLDHGFVRNSQAVVIECTFFEPEHLTRARAGKHIHVTDLPSLLEAIPEAQIMLIHVTRRTDLRVAKRILERTLGPSDRDRVQFLMDRTPRPPRDRSAIQSQSRPDAGRFSDPGRSHFLDRRGAGHSDPQPTRLRGG